MGKYSPAPRKAGMSEREYWLFFSVFSGIGPVKFAALLKHFGSAKTAWIASRSQLTQVLGEKTAEKFEGFKKEFSIDQYQSKMKKTKASFVTLADEEYPSLLKQIQRPPFVLYVKGILHYDNTYHYSGSIAIVGTRKITNYGREVTEMFSQDLVAHGFTIVSGLAMGVDAVAHKIALENGGKTIAVLGCGVDCCTPEENLYLYDSIIEHGGVILSELPLGHPPNKGSFPARNRIIAGLSLGVLVTEGAEDSGALITADYALKFNRKVFAVPGPITSSLSKGPYKLIAKGASLVTKVDDILQELKFEARNPKSETNSKSKFSKNKDATKEEKKILEILENEPLHFDEIVRRLGLNSAKVGSMLSFMEVKGMVKSLDSGIFSLSS